MLLAPTFILDNTQPLPQYTRIPVVHLEMYKVCITVYIIATGPCHESMENTAFHSHTLV